MKKIIIAVSSTGGHIYPGLALASILKDSYGESVFIGKNLDLISREGYGTYKISAKGFQRKFNFSLIVSVAGFICAIFQSVYILVKEKPCVVAGFGGYVSLPVIIASWMLRIPCFIHEQNFIPGLANRLSAMFADKICISFEESKKYFPSGKIVFTGNPVRPQIKTVSRISSVSGPDTLMIFGGSQGAHSLNEAFIKGAVYIASFGKRLRIIHITGRNDYKIVKDAYSVYNINAEVHEYMHDIGKAYRDVSLLVSRAGATTMAEIISLKIPAVLVPYPNATENHQSANAEYLSSRGCALRIEEKYINNLLPSVFGLLSDKNKLQKMIESYSRISYSDTESEFLSLVSILCLRK